MNALGLFDRLFRPRNVAAVNHNGGYWKMLDGYVPAYHTWGGEIYESELVRAAIDARARYIAKLNIEIEGTAKGATRRALTDRPNELQTWSQFMYRVSTILDVQNTAFCVPQYDDYGNVVGVYPVLPTGCDVIDVSGEPWIRYTFAGGKRAACKMSDCTVLRKHQYKSDLFGDQNDALNDTMRLIEVQRQAIAEAARQSSAYRFMARSNNFMKSEDLERERKRFNKNIMQSGEGGAILFPNTWTEIKQIDSKAYTVSADEQRVIQDNVCNYYGVSVDVMQNKGSSETMNAFYNGVVQPFAIQFSEAMTAMIFSRMERTRGNRLTATSNRLEYEPLKERMELVKQLADRGALTTNEIRDIAANLKPFEGKAGTFIPIRGEYHDVNTLNEEAKQLYENAPAKAEDKEQEGLNDGTGTAGEDKDADREEN